MLDDEPLWAKLKDKQRYLESQQILAYEDALRYKLGLNGIVDLEKFIISRLAGIEQAGTLQ